jgi:mercuric ion transport protein|tara:strand:- start:394 stop:612 length:219 start_codon:yes stop_codon:yes gene_type:complete
MNKIKDRKILKIGIIGMLITAVCCFTPLLVIIFTSLGIATWLGYTDYILLPLLTMFVGIILWGIILSKKKAN